MKRTLAVILVFVFVFAFAVPVFAQSMVHNAEYKMNGIIDIEKQVGHFCNTGAEMKQTIKGEGEMTKVMDTTQVAGKLTVSDHQDWVTAEDAVRNLTVTSVIELCAPAKSEFNLDDLLADILDELDVEDPVEAIDDSLLLSRIQNLLKAHTGAVVPTTILYEILSGNISAAVLGAFGINIDASDYVDPISDQIWAVQVSADPGFSGALNQNFEAAYGPWADAHSFPYYWGDADEPDVGWWYVDDDGEQISPLQALLTGATIDGVETGKDYVGNYFNMEQFARTSQGTVRRYINISSPWSHAYAYEDATITGASEIEDSFAMGNLAPGEDVVPDWWDLF